MRQIDTLKWAIFEQRDYTSRYFQYEKTLPLKVSTNNPSIFPLLTKIANPTLSYKDHYCFYIHDVKPQSKVFSHNWPDGKKITQEYREKIFQSGRGHITTKEKGYVYVCHERLLPEAFLSHLQWLLSRLMHNSLQNTLPQVHASTLTVGGRGVLLIGHAGAGKTTLAIKGLKDGLGFVSDDHSYLKKEGDLIWVLGLDRMVKLKKDGFEFLGIRKFPYVYESIALYGKNTYVFDIEKVFPGKWVSNAPGAVLCFLCQEMRGKPAVKISAQEALNMLLSRGFFYSPSDPVTAIDLAIDLVKQTRYYKLNPLKIRITELCRFLNSQIC